MKRMVRTNKVITEQIFVLLQHSINGVLNFAGVVINNELIFRHFGDLKVGMFGEIFGKFVEEGEVCGLWKPTLFV